MAKTTINFNGTIYTGTSYKQLLAQILANPWTGTLDDLISRVYKYYGVSLDISSAKNTIEHLISLGEISILNQ
jgi:hypothetical protein